MKLKLSVKGESNKYPYSTLAILTFCSLYIILPYFLQAIVGDSFYIYSSSQNSSILPSLYFFLNIVICFAIIIHDLKWHNKINIGKLTTRSYKLLIWLTIIYLIIIALRDIPLKLGGASRTEMLGAISRQLLPGFGFLLLLSFISIIQSHNKKLLLIFCLICFLVDIIHEGKIFTSYALLCMMFYFDDSLIKISLKRIILIGCIGLCFLTMIFFMRASAVGENPFLSVYSLFSEFMGVNATSGWAIEYSNNNLPPDLNDFDTTLRNYYINNVGHGLALSPVAYFIGNFPSYYLVVPLYFGIITLIYLAGNRLIGQYSILILLYNLIHLLRHGPNLFLSKSISQIIFVSILFIWINNYNTNNKPK